MKLNTRELVLVWITCVAILFVGTIIVCRQLGYVDQLRDNLDEIQAIKDEMAANRDLLTRRNELQARLNDIRSRARSISADAPSDTHLKRLVDGLAAQNNIALSDRRAGTEMKYADLRVLPITCRWETQPPDRKRGGTDWLVGLLTTFQKHQMILDMTKLDIKSHGQERLSGTFTVTCIYRKEGEDQ